MKVQQRTRLAIEVLESRLLPATIVYDGANLLISNPRVAGGSSSVTVAQGTGDAFTVMDQTAYNGTFAVSGGLTIATNNAPAQVAVHTTATGLLGDLAITTGNGQSTVTVDGTATGPNAGPGTVSGDTAITLGGNGGQVNLGTVAGLNDAGLMTLQNNGGAPATVVTGNATVASTFSGNLFAGNFSGVTLGNATKGDTFGGNVVVRHTDDPQNTIFTLNAGSKILGDVGRPRRHGHQRRERERQCGRQRRGHAARLGQ